MLLANLALGKAELCVDKATITRITRNDCAIAVDDLTGQFYARQWERAANTWDSQFSTDSLPPASNICL
jgi:DNA relaxase NicK